jgi:hypothetical protein
MSVDNVTSNTTMNEPNLKKLKTTEEDDSNLLNQFQYNRLLNESCLKKLAFVHGTKSENGETKDAIIILEKPHFTQNEIKAIIEENFSTDLTLTNDIYKKLCVYPTKPFNSK